MVFSRIISHFRAPPGTAPHRIPQTPAPLTTSATRDVRQWAHVRDIYRGFHGRQSSGHRRHQANRRLPAAV